MIVMARQGWVVRRGNDNDEAIEGERWRRRRSVDGDDGRQRWCGNGEARLLGLGLGGR